MWTYNYSDELYHHGIKGMKWGVRRSQATLDRLAGRVKAHQQKEKDFRKKLSTIDEKQSKYGNITDGDLKRIKYRNQSLGMRAGKTAASLLAGKLITECLSGSAHRYTRMNKAQLADELMQLAVQTTGVVVARDALAKSTAKKFTDTGRRVRGKHTEIVSKEVVLEIAVNTAASMMPVYVGLAKTKVSHAAKTRARDEERVRRWGQNILPQKVDHIVWQSDDLSAAIIDSRR